MLRVNEMFCSIQGEGKFTGIPSFFVRTVGCNLRCVFSNSICDTAYTSFKPEKPLYDTWDDLMNDFQKMIDNNPTVCHLVISGGEPLIQHNDLKEFINRVHSKKQFIITIETNGTLPAIEPWDDSDFNYWVDLWSVSPKLSTSVDHQCKFLTEAQRDNHDKTRINYDNLASYIIATRKADESNRAYEPDFEDGTPDYQLKFVYSGEDSVGEIKEILTGLSNEYNIDFDNLNKHVMLMPEGTTNDQLKDIQQECAKVCIREGWQFCDRLHIRIWGDKREV